MIISVTKCSSLLLNFHIKFIPSQLESYERTEISSGGVYSLLNRVLGGKIGAAVGTVFAFGLCVTAALYATSFATAALASADMNPTDNRWEIAGLGQVNIKASYNHFKSHAILCKPQKPLVLLFFY